jgi:hypothetical protein
LFSFSYGYFARVEEWTSRATHPEDLTENKLLASRLLMSDQLFHWSVNDSWTYSHGENGPRGGSPQETVETGHPMNLAGLNQLFGDGRVIWKSGASLNSATLSPSTPNAAYAIGWSTDDTFY